MHCGLKEGGRRGRQIESYLTILIRFGQDEDGICRASERLRATKLEGEITHALSMSASASEEAETAAT